MLNTSSVNLQGTESFEEAYALIPQSDKARVRNLYAKEGRHYEATGVCQISIDEGKTWSTRNYKRDKNGQIIPIDLDSKHKLANTSLFYDVFTKPTYAGSNASQSWLVGDIDGCNIMGDDYNIQGLIISTIFDPIPKYYISFKRIVCDNQFGNLGRNSSSMYIDMNYFLNVANHTQESRERLTNIIQAEVEKRIGEADRVYNKLATTHLTDDQIDHMFRMLTVDKVAKNNEEKYKEQERLYSRYLTVYDSDDNQNYKQSLFGFVNACTNVRTRVQTNPLDVIKPVLPANVIDSPCNFDYLCRAAMLQSIA